MKLNTYKNYRICSKCGETKPLTRDFFKRLKTPQGEIGYHHICKTCEDKARIEKEWKNGKLLCHCCGQYKDVADFSPNGEANSIRNNRRSICKTCCTERQRERHLSLDSESKLNKCLNSRLLAAKDRANVHQIPFNISLDYLIELWNTQNGVCALSGIKMTYELKKGRIPTNVSIDKIDRTKGYVTGNIQLVCMACNQIKSDMSEELMYFFCKNIVEHYENKDKETSTAA